MLNDNRLREANALALQWHAGALTVGFEALQPWCLASLKPRVRFDGAIWGVLSGRDIPGTPRLNSVHVHRIADGVLERFEQIHADELAADRPLGSALTICLSDRAWQGPEHAALREHGSRYELAHTVSVRFADAMSPGQQFILLGRKAAGPRFSADEVGSFELLAPHMMQAYATGRRLLLERSQSGDVRVAGSAVAMVDRAGVIHDAHAHFLTMLQREWSDWPGQRLPEPLLDLTARRAGTRWRFLGAQVSAEFVPVNDLYLVTLRPRHVLDGLTPREGEVAKRYAAGGNFREIAEALGLAPATVRSHLRNVFGKLQIRNKSQLAAAMR